MLAIAFAVGSAATVAMMGVASSENFLRIIGIIGGHKWFSLEPRWEVAAANVSLDAFVARPLMIFFGFDFPRDKDWLRRALVLLVKVAILAGAFRATANAKDDSHGRNLSLWVATMLILTPVVWLHYQVMLIVPFGLIAVAAIHRQTGPHIWRFAAMSYALIVLATPLMSSLTFRNDILDWRAGAVAELGFLALLSAWIAAWRFAMERPAESSNTEDLHPAPPRS